MVSRKQQAPRCTVWRAHYLYPLPPIPVPLAAPDPDLTLELAPLIGAVYARSHYDRDIDYGIPLSPALNEAEVAWLQKRLSEQRS